MSEQNPPIPYPVNPIYNPNDWIPQNDVTIDVAYLDAHYLRYPTAQGTETLQTINVNGIATFFNTSQFRQQVQVVDTTAISTTTECLILAQTNNNNRIGFTLNPVSGAYNGITQANDNLLGFGDVGAASTSLVIAPWSTTTNGIRMTQTDTMMGSGGTSQSPTHRLNTDTTQFRITSPAFKVDGNMTQISTSSASRQIFSSYYNMADTALTTTPTSSRFFHTVNTTYLINETGNPANMYFGFTLPSPVQIMNLTPSTATVNGDIVISGTGNFLRFPDNTTQTTAYTTSVLKVQTFTITTNQTNYLIPTNVYKVDFKVIGRGGNYGAQNGSYTGGSGAGAQTVMLNGCPLIDGYYINISFVATAGATIGYTQVQDVYDSTIIARAYNGGDGGNATASAGGIAGVVSPFSGTTNPVINSNYGNAYALQGTNGSAGALNVFPVSIGLVRGSPPNTTFNYGNGNLNSTSTWGTGAVIITMYYK